MDVSFLLLVIVNAVSNCDDCRLDTGGTAGGWLMPFALVPGQKDVVSLLTHMAGVRVKVRVNSASHPIPPLRL